MTDKLLYTPAIWLMYKVRMIDKIRYRTLLLNALIYRGKMANKLYTVQLTGQRKGDRQISVHPTNWILYRRRGTDELLYTPAYW